MSTRGRVTLAAGGRGRGCAKERTGRYCGSKEGARTNEYLALPCGVVSAVQCR